MNDRVHESTAAFRGLLDLLGAADAAFLAGERAVRDDTTVAEGYRYLLEALHAALEIHLWSDPQRPKFVPITSPTFKWGGDNSDAFYFYAPVRGDLDYVVRGRFGADTVYSAVCVYGGPDDGRWSTRIVSSVNDRDLHVDADGSFEIVVARSRPADVRNWLPLDDDAVAIVTRDYHTHSVHETHSAWQIEAATPAPPPPALTDAELAARLRATTNFLRELFTITPLPPADPPNTIQEVWKVPDVTYGWAAKDAHYAMGSFDLADDEALVVEGTSPECAYWGLMLWNPYMQTFDYRYERIGINGAQVVTELDGSWRIVVAHRDPGVANWLSTAGHERGVLFFRWFVAASTPRTPTTRVVGLSDL
ncbi:MAG TPA: DUF1214 domain-containing protein [Acidimicrobiia bacterium]|nr:DUF1214 domain-containing protein [Acidimicrobiia bacterium]